MNHNLLQSLATRIGASPNRIDIMATSTVTLSLQIEGMTCSSCSNTVAQAVEALACLGIKVR